jgi:hypothetical protein
MDFGTTLTSILVPLGIFAIVALIIWLVNRAKVQNIRALSELQKHFLDKFGTGQELAQFLETPQGQKFLSEMTIKGGNVSPKDRIMKSIKSGIVLVALGAGFFALMRLEYDLIYPAVILSVLGLGMLISAAISYWLSKRWNIFDESDITFEKLANLKP